MKRREDSYTGRANDGAIPVLHHDVLSVNQSVANGAISDPLLSFLKFFQQAKVTWN